MKQYQLYLNENSINKILQLNENNIEISHPGAFTDYCKKHGFDGVTCECICKAMKSNDKTLHKRANFAYNFGFKKKGKTCECMQSKTSIEEFINIFKNNDNEKLNYINSIFKNEINFKSMNDFINFTMRAEKGFCSKISDCVQCDEINVSKNKRIYVKCLNEKNGNNIYFSYSVKNKQPVNYKQEKQLLGKPIIEQ